MGAVQSLFNVVAQHAAPSARNGCLMFHNRPSACISTQCVDGAACCATTLNNFRAGILGNSSF